MQPEAQTEDIDTESVDTTHDSIADSITVATTSQLDAQKDAETSKDGSVATGPEKGQASGKANGQQNGNHFPPPKTDKPRPHVCGTCGRSFARLEHLKRHERSHTKEKPFECPECTRCFARRDLLLRHQQKLHQTPNNGPRRGSQARRESVSRDAALGPPKVRKNSVAIPRTNGHQLQGTRPRANTISHIDFSSLRLMDSMSSNLNHVNALGITGQNGMGLAGLPGAAGFDYRGMSNAMGNHGNIHDLKLDTSVVNNMDTTNSLRTAPPMASFGHFDLDQLLPGTTVNPAQLHFGGPASATQPSVPQVPAMANQHGPLDEHDEFGWMRNWNLQISHDGNDNAVDDSSPSRLSSGDSPGDMSEVPSASTGVAMQMGFQWPQQDINTQHNLSTGAFHLESLGNGLPNLDPSHGMLSPTSFQDNTPTADAYFHQAMLQQQQNMQHQIQASPADMVHVNGSNFFPPASVSNFSHDSPSMSGSSMTGSARQSSVTSISTDSITDSTRQALLASLAQSSVFGSGHRKYSQPSVSSPLSPNPGRGSLQGPNLPSTSDIRRYIDAFLQYAHPHLPVTHIPTVTFDPETFSSSIKLSTTGPLSPGASSSLSGGGGCLILGMAAIGALYEYEHPASKELFEAAKRMIQLYLEERRKADMCAAVNGSPGTDVNHTPLWLVKAMLLTVIYGHHCGDKTAADIASNHSAALVSLARAADLMRPQKQSPLHGMNNTDLGPNAEDVKMEGDDHSQVRSAQDLHLQWLLWKEAEERKRCLFAIFVVSSLLTTGYNQAPTIMNSEILLDLPCDEELFSAESAQEWQNRGGLAAAEASSISFAGALNTLLTANQRNGAFGKSTYNNNDPTGALRSGEATGDIELRPSTFGCLVLINALHNYIWETRSRHNSRQWTAQETESMFSHIEPALNAWQAAWKANDRHKLERPNPFGLGPLSADSIPLLDLAFVRLFVNLGRSKEAFWMRDFDAMANELARGSEIVQHAEGTIGKADRRRSSASHNENRRPSQAQVVDQTSSKRERHLRKAAFYAADSLTIACNYNLTYADATGHDLPIQSAICFFDCGQVLAEWACTVQERVGSYLGVLGRDHVDFTQVPAIMLLETEDVELLRKIERICDSMEAKRFQQESLLAMDLQQLNPSTPMNGMQSNVNLSGFGYGSKILRIVAMMLEKAVVWPLTHVMAKALQVQAGHMDQRADSSAIV